MIALIVLGSYLVALTASIGAWGLIHRRQRGTALLADRRFAGHELAVLGGGVEQAVDHVVASLEDGGHVVRRGDLIVWTGRDDDQGPDPHPYRGDAPASTIHPAEAEVVTALTRGPRTRTQLVALASRRVRAVERSLARGGWMVYDWQRRGQALRARMPVLLVSAAGVVGASYWLDGPAVVRLGLIGMATAGFALAWLLPRHLRLTPSGQAALAATRRRDRSAPDLALLGAGADPGGGDRS